MANNQRYAYAPYVREMNLWLKYVDQVCIVGPMSNDFDRNISLAYQHKDISISEVPAFSLIGLKEKLKTLKKLPKILSVIYSAMKQADHIHLRCPGNMGLLGCMVQIFFPKTPKTAKYAGNWDPEAKQPWSYNLQKWILSNTLLTKNMQVLVYGEWPNQTKNIKPFFTASYSKSEKEDIYIRNYTQKLKFCFVGSLSKGKQPDLALKFLVELKSKLKEEVQFDVYGDGELKSQMHRLIKEHQAQDWVFLHGNQPKAEVKKNLKYSHFLILPSRSEGWPKVVAEAMFWGCIPVVTPVSCVPWMLAEGDRGILMHVDDSETDLKQLKVLINRPESLENMSKSAAEWSRQFTLDKFEFEIRKLINNHHEK
jgi:glycosyltransferase involved in cell wall biosynthesis